MSNGIKNKIKIAFLFRATENWLGGVNYYKNLLQALSLVDKPILEPYILDVNREKFEEIIKDGKVQILKKDIKYYFLKFFQSLLKKDYDKTNALVSCNDIDVISHSYCEGANVPNIFWIPDFQHVYLPEMFSDEEIDFRNKEFFKMAKNSDLVILSSEDALNDFKKFVPQYAHKGKVLNFVAIPNKNIYEETDKIKFETIKKYNLFNKYFYVPNQFWKHKNHKVVLEAISILKKQGLNINVVFTGNTCDIRNPKYFEEIMSYIVKENIQDNVKILGIVDLLEVHYLMRNCVSIINPSLFEGWSSTVEEAKSIGKNIILSNLDVHKEQNPQEAVYFNPNDSKELAMILKQNWETKCGGPDYELEEQAKELLPKRILEFGQQYQKIILEALKIEG